MDNAEASGWTIAEITIAISALADEVMLHEVDIEETNFLLRDILKSTPVSPPIEPAEFLRWWIFQHIGIGSQLADAAMLAQSLAEDASQVGIEEAALETAAGRPIAKLIEAAIKKAIEEGLL